jgi:hypothetical protein
MPAPSPRQISSGPSRETLRLEAEAPPPAHRTVHRHSFPCTSFVGTIPLVNSRSVACSSVPLLRGKEIEDQTGRPGELLAALPVPRERVVVLPEAFAAGELEHAGPELRR